MRRQKKKGAKRRRLQAQLEEHVCECCGSDKNLRYGVNPYAAELHGDTTEMYICDECYYARAEDI